MPWCGHNPIVEGCRSCWLIQNDERYQKLWGVNKEKIGDQCVHLGAKLDETLQYQTCCSGTQSVDVYSCAEFGKCTKERKMGDVACCLGCNKKAPN